MIRIAYEITSLAQSPFGGIAKVCYHTLCQAVRTDGTDPAGYFRRGDPEAAVATGVPVKKPSLHERMRWTRFDIVHALCHRLLNVSCSKLVYTLHDAWSLYPNEFQSAEFQRKVGKRIRRDLVRADAIVTPSKWTFAQLCRLDIVDPAKCHISQYGVVTPESEVQASCSTEIQRLVTKPYVLFVGRLETRKNIGHLVEAVLPLKHLNLLMVGEPGHGYEQSVVTALDRLPANRLHVLSRVGESDLRSLYENAVAALLPSREEGFGLPVLEAMAHGCPVITSNRSACAEVGGNAVILVEPDEPDQSRVALERLVDDNGFRKDMVQIGHERCRKFSWPAYFDRLVVIYSALLN
jgi:glycosyltransferase involved in cell wall biosynthesis